MNNKVLWNSLLVTPALLGVTLVFSSNQAQAAAGEKGNLTEAAAQSIAAPTQTDPTIEAIATPVLVAQAVPEVAPTDVTQLEQIQRYSNETNPGGDPMEQLTSASQLRDVRPTDWAFQSLQSLIERYGCIGGYPDATYRGNRALTRFEFAAGLNSCLDRINELIAAATASTITRADLATLQRLQEEFAAELATLRGRVDALEARTAELEANRFSTTTKLRGEVIINTGGVFGDERADGSSNDVNENWTLSARTRLNFLTTFAGGSSLLTRLQAGNINNLGSGVTGTNMTRLGFATNTGGDFGLSKLGYRLPVANDSLVFWLAATGYDQDDFHPVLSPIASSSSGSLSRFGRFNPIYRVPGGAGAGVEVNLGEQFKISGSYLTDNSSDPSDGEGLFNGSYSAMGQLTFDDDAFKLGLSYARAYWTNDEVNLTGSTGSANATVLYAGEATSANVMGATTQIRLGRGLILSGWFGWMDVIEEGGNDRHSAIYNWAGTLALPDLFAEGNLGAIQVGMLPKVVSGARRDDNTGGDGTSLQIQGLYRIRVNDNITITPGVYAILNPEHNENNDTIYVGTIRTTFKF
ncbi:MAG: carbohydrate porin [Hormoscilla sp. GM7CHS1pb]|nr:carbohydrate porin [Hormoscilla sp. GM7CHS1pb]